MSNAQDKRTEIETKTCGIVMPIAAMGDAYSEEHWRRVRRILQRAVERAGMQPKLVWENPEIDVIQSAILQNLYENDVVICDVSGLNPNVMLEAGLRLSTKRPTIIVTDKEVKPPFDISNIGYIDYQRDLEYNAIEKFIDTLSEKIKSVSTAAANGTYKSFVEQFTFETVTPATVNVTAEDFLRDQIAFLTSTVRRIEIRQRNEFSGSRMGVASPRIRNPRSFRLLADLTPEIAQRVELKLDALDGFGVCTVDLNDDGKYIFSISLSEDSKFSRTEGLSILKSIIDEGESDSLPF